jgi:alpha-1,2-mannosyltransferase
MIFGKARGHVDSIAIILVLVLLMAVGYSTVYRAGPYRFLHRQWGSPLHRCDLSVYTAAGEAVLRGQDIYAAHNSRGWFYVYPPTFALLMAPFALIPLFWASLLWYVLSVLMVFYAVRRSYSMMLKCNRVTKKIFWLVVISLLLISWPLVSALEHGQSTPLLLLLVTLALAYEQDRRDICGGIALGGAILLKVFPILLLSYFVWRRRWRFLAAAAGCLALGWALPAIRYGWTKNVHLWSEWFSRVLLPAISKEPASHHYALYSTLLDPSMLNNQSLSVVLFRVTGNGDSRFLALAIVIAMAAVMLVAGRHYRPENEHVVLSALIAWMLLASPIAWAHYFILLLFPLAVLLSFTESSQAPKCRRIAFGASAGFAILCIVDATSYSLQSLGVLCWGTMVLWGALAYLMSIPAAVNNSPT